MELINKSGLEFKELEGEIQRVYRFHGGEKVIIHGAKYIHVSDNGHRILDEFEVSHYIPFGWIHLEWITEDRAPHFSV